ncbi:MAG TPA: hypothetical protein EYH43_02110 [Persephonella sp.]|nr:hypothetical protein [Hydrogenothermaceae bacterium]HIQ24762.1 hypothetical protein [Persephonella sp.]
MKKYTLYFLVFFTAFFATFVYTFPIKNLLSFYANKFGFEYSKIDGNLFKITIKDLSYKDLYIKTLSLHNKLIFMDIFVDKDKLADINLLDKSLVIKANKLQIEEFQKKPKIYGNLDLYLNIFVKDNYILSEGKGKITLKKVSFIPFASNLNIDFSIKNRPPKNFINISIRGAQIDYAINADLILPLDKKQIILNGISQGKIFGRNVKQKIDIDFIKGIINKNLYLN